MEKTNSRVNKVKNSLIETVRYLSEEIGQRSYLDIKNLNKSAEFIEKSFKDIGLGTKRQPFKYQGNTYQNIIAEIEGRKIAPPLIIGAHYDTVIGTPGADDNSSGIAGLIELARLAKETFPEIPIRFIAFSLEEPPAFRTSAMGSHIYATSIKERGERIFAMISLEMIGYYCMTKGCQFYPLPFFRWFYPDRGDFIALVGNLSSRRFTKNLKRALKDLISLRVESLNTISLIPGVDFSDHRPFWRLGYPALMITDTAFFRNPFYHCPGDKVETLNYDLMAELILGIHKALLKKKTFEF